MRLEFIKNVVNIDVDGLRGVNHYVINAMYDEIDEDGFARITQKLVDEFDYTWDEIERDGGITEINRQLKEIYGV